MVDDHRHRHPFDGQVLMLAGAKASVAPRRLPALVDDVATHLAARRDDYRRSYERVAEADDGVPGLSAPAEVFLVPVGHWEEVGELVGLSPRETDAVRRVHTETLRRVGKASDRDAEFETALEVREAVVVGR